VTSNDTRNRGLEAIAAALLASKESILPPMPPIWLRPRSTAWPRHARPPGPQPGPPGGNGARRARCGRLPDPLGEIYDQTVRPNGLLIGKRACRWGRGGRLRGPPQRHQRCCRHLPEDRNAAILRGGHEARQANAAIVAAIGRGLAAAGLPQEAVQLIASTDRAVVGRMLRLHGAIDVIIPRGGAG